MNNLDFSFEHSPWEIELTKLPQGGQVDAVHFLTMMESEPEEILEEALTLLEEKQCLLNIDGLTGIMGSGELALRLRQEKELVDKQCLPEGLEENDPLRLFLEELAEIPACGDVHLLLQESLDGKEESAQLLAGMMMHRVVQIAYELAGRGVLLMDLIQEGNLALWQGILSYTGGDFEAHCEGFVRRTMHKTVLLQAREFGVGQRMRQAIEDYRAVDERLLSDLGRNPTVEEIAQEMHMSIQETVQVADMLENARRMKRARQEPEPEEEELAQNQAVEDTAYFQMRQRIGELLSSLDEQDAKLLSLRYGLEAGLPKSAEEVGKQLNMTPEEVTAREAAALAKLRNEG